MNSHDMRSERMPIGDGFTVSFSFVDGKLDAEWHPRLPDNSALNRKYLEPYRRARNEFFRRVARRTGTSIMVVDL